jgi:hypothetical protein
MRLLHCKKCHFVRLKLRLVDVFYCKLILDEIIYFLWLKRGKLSVNDMMAHFGACLHAS